MKTIFSLANIAMLLLAPAPGRCSESLQATVTHVQGDARYETSGTGFWRVLRLGDQLDTGSHIQTARTDSIVAISLGPAGTLRLLRDSRVSLIKLSSKPAQSTPVTEVKLGLALGQIVAALGQNAECVVELVGAKTPLRFGTRQDSLKSQEIVFVFNDSGILTLLKGVLTLRTGTGKEQPLSAGEQFRTDTAEVTKLAQDAPERNLWP